jgi:hypothetical protein
LLQGARFLNQKPIQKEIFHINAGRIEEHEVAIIILEDVGLLMLVADQGFSKTCLWSSFNSQVRGALFGQPWTAEN